MLHCSLLVILYITCINKQDHKTINKKIVYFYIVTLNASHRVEFSQFNKAVETQRLP